jgi:hypothetical protein
MAEAVTCAGCGKEYRWKPELAGKRAKCKCGGVVSFPKADPAAAAAAPPPPPPPIPDVPEGFEDYGMAADAPPPPPPPPPIPGRRPAAAAAPTAPATGGFKDSTASGGAGFHWNWKAALNVLIGLGLIGFGFVEFAHIGQLEARHETVHFTGRRSFYLTIMYQIGGRIGVLGFFVIAGILFIGGAVLVMMGKIGHSESKH